MHWQWARAVQTCRTHVVESQVFSVPRLIKQACETSQVVCMGKFQQVVNLRLEKILPAGNNIG